MSRSSTDRLADIVEHLERIQRLTEGYDFDRFVSDEAVYFAVLFNLGVVEEAVKSIPDEIRSLDEEIDWRNISRFRDFVFHVYFGISDEVIWKIVTEDVPGTLARIRALVEKSAKIDPSA